jgi:ABC-type uncharacterized transport system permease subunit
MIPGPYSSSGQFDPGTANILESIRLRKQREQWEAQQREQADARDRQANWQAPQQQWEQPDETGYQWIDQQPVASPRKRNVVVRLMLGLLKLAFWAMVLMIGLVVLAALFG